MAIKPVDFQVMLPKTSEVSKIHSDEQQKNQALQQQQAASTQHRVDDSLRQVHSQDRTQEARIREKQDKGQGNRKEDKEKKKNRGNYTKSKELTSDERTSIIDIRV